MSCQRRVLFLSLPTVLFRAEVFYVGDSQTVRRRIFQNVVFSFNLFVLFFQTATKLLGQIVINLFWPNYLIDGSVGYLYWPWGAAKNCWDTTGAVNRESLLADAVRYTGWTRGCVGLRAYVGAVVTRRSPPTLEIKSWLLEPAIRGLFFLCMKWFILNLCNRFLLIS
jgi:hypothetical protein